MPKSTVDADNMTEIKDDDLGPELTSSPTYQILEALDFNCNVHPLLFQCLHLTFLCDLLQQYDPYFASPNPKGMNQFTPSINNCNVTFSTKH